VSGDTEMRVGGDTGKCEKTQKSVKRHRKVWGDTNCQEQSVRRHKKVSPSRGTKCEETQKSVRRHKLSGTKCEETQESVSVTRHKV